MVYRTVTVVGGDLFHVAAQYLGDATQAVRIAALNGLTDFSLRGLATLKLPNPDQSQTGGVPVQ
jgi:hypothetical protein